MIESSLGIKLRIQQGRRHNIAISLKYAEYKWNGVSIRVFLAVIKHRKTSQDRKRLFTLHFSFAVYH